MGPLYDCDESFCSHACLSRLLPCVERLEWAGERSISCDFLGLTRLTHLELHSAEGNNGSPIQPRVWDALATLTQLRHLAMDLAAEQLPQLARLPAGLSALRAQVAGAV